MATNTRNKKLIFETLIPIDWASCLETMLKANSRYIRNMVKNTNIIAAMVIRASVGPIFVMSPNNASSSSGSGVIKIPRAKLNAKNIPTNVSDGNSVLLSRNQIPTIAKNKAVKAPKKGLI